MSRTALLGLSVSLLLGACSGEAKQMSPVAASAREVQQLVTAMNGVVVAADAAANAGVASLEKERARFDTWLAARTAFLEALRDLEAPTSLEDLYARAIDIVADLRDATEELSDIAHSANTLDEMWAAMQAGPLADYEAADQRALSLCLEVQAAFIEKLQGAVAFTSPWLQGSGSSPEAIDVNLGCFAQP
jgi:hypothetical protein